MQGKTFKAALLGAVALASGQNAFAADPDPAELFDPAVVARGLCAGDSGKTNRLKTFVQIAAAQNLPAPTSRPPLWRTLGDYSFKISTKTPEAQAYFDQGLRLAYGFNHAEAIRAFKTAQQLDPNCAMCFWGEAWALGPNINLLMATEDNDQAIAAASRAQELAKTASPREQALIAAVAKRYSKTGERKVLDLEFAQAMWEAQGKFPLDPDIATIAVEAAMDTTPWEYWQNSGREPVDAMAKAYPLLESTLKANPRHPGAIHFYIHVMESSVWPEKAEPYADVLGGLMPGAGHMVHMPSHTYFQVGRYQDSLRVNLDAVAADEAYFKEAEPSPMYAAGYYPHNIHFALESAAMAGDGATTLAQADKLAKAIPAEAYRAVVAAQPIGSAVLYAKARFGSPDDILATANPGDDVPFMKGIWLYARGIGQVLNGDIEAARREHASLTKLRKEADLDALESNAIPANGILDVADLVLGARIAGARGDWGAAVTLYEQAALRQDALPYMEPAYWYYPVRQSLGHALLQAGRAKEAVDVLKQSLMDAPNNGWALHVLKDAAAKAGDPAAAAAYAKLFDKAWAGSKAPDEKRL